MNNLLNTRRKRLIAGTILGGILVMAILTGILVITKQPKPTTTISDNKPVTQEVLPQPDPKAGEEPAFSISTVVEGLANPWDIAFASNDIFIYNQRGGEIRGFNQVTKENWLIEKPSDVYARGEGGMLGMIVDTNFTQNRFIYACFNVKNGPSISVVRWKLSENFKQASQRTDIVTGMPSNTSGRHSGCRMAMDKNGNLWIGTGDTASDGRFPQDPQSLAGKILRVDREGRGIAGNLDIPFDNRIFSYGHRNTQGIVLFDEPINEVYGFTTEHGSTVDDEVNLLKQGNFGWDPVPGYNEGLPMTNLSRFPDAIPAIWSSGNPTIAISGIEILKGNPWHAWNGALLVAVQKDRHVRLIKLDHEYNVIRDSKIFTEFGRIRIARQGPDGNLYLLTDNGGNDKVIKVVPTE